MIEHEPVKPGDVSLTLTGPSKSCSVGRSAMRHSSKVNLASSTLAHCTKISGVSSSGKKTVSEADNGGSIPSTLAKKF